MMRKSSFRASSAVNAGGGAAVLPSTSLPLNIPHQGSLCRYDDYDFEADTVYAIEIAIASDLAEEEEGEVSSEHQPDDWVHQLRFNRKDFEFAQRLFAILDTESRGLVERRVIEEFATLRCPVFWRRDDDLKRLGQVDIANDNCSPTFDEIWDSVVLCSRLRGSTRQNNGGDLIGVEGWMVFCRFVALAQYLEAKRRFSARHSQQTMRHRNAPRGSELVVVDVPPPAPPASLSPLQLANYERQCKQPLPLPELDLDHSMLAAHDRQRRSFPRNYRQAGSVKISLFGPSSTSFSSSLLNASGPSSSNIEFAVTYTKHTLSSDSASVHVDEVVVRRSMADMKWLNDTFASHKVLGGTLCGRILPPFPGTSSSTSAFGNEDSVTTSIKSTGDAITAAAASGVGRVRSFARSIFDSYVNGPGSASGAPVPSDGDSIASHSSSAVVSVSKKSGGVKKKGRMSNRIYPESYCNPNSPASRANQVERYLNYLLEHPALSTSFPLNTILKVSSHFLLDSVRLWH